MTLGGKTIQPVKQSTEVGVICGYAFWCFYQEVSGTDQTAFFADDIGFCVCQLLEGGRYIDPVISVEKVLLCFFKVRSLDQFIWVSAIIACLEEGRGKRMRYRVTYETESFHYELR